ncbi:phage tail tape measure protein [Terrihabitans rhizophilus]|uniref:Phage tail tape measure protein n=1 Tax=Terrihabitans rhizophilus TaxID=3092662 RepID=A0ABU4RSE0_9HYPH|nr:phage tail tape measure protein [Terrihabitans sp. PJ23]MDX6806565.1 phage tail tape measure protein [Terrihabitans sp. PJ23]
MALDEETRVLTIDADTSKVERSLIELDRLSRGFGRSLTSALEGAAVRGQSLSTVLQGLGQRLVDLALRSAMKPLENSIAGALGNIVGGVLPFAKGGVVGGQVQPFATGGVVSTPTFFPMAGGRTGLMGEAGSEAILPLARGSDGRLGVRGGGGGSHVTVNISTPDAGSFRRSEAQVSAQLARAVARGRRGM